MKKTIPVIGMACSACSANVERKLRSLEGMNEVSVSLAGRTATVDFDPEKLSLDDMKREISDIGYDMVIESGRSAEEINRREYKLLTRRTALSWVFAVAVMSVSMGWIAIGGKPYTHSQGTDIANQTCLIMALLNMCYCGRQFYISAWRQLRHATANMDSLVALSTIIVFLFSSFNTFWGDTVWGASGMEWHTYFDASVMIVSFVLTGRCIEEKAKDGTASSIRRLMGMQPKTARLVSGGTTTDVPIAAIEKGDTIEVRAGEKIPVDGTVVSAESYMTADAAYVDEAMISGEPTPAVKRAGDEVLAGTIPSQGKLRMKARQIGRRHGAGTHHTHRAGGARQQSARAAHRRQGCAGVRAYHHSTCRGDLRRMVGYRRQQHPTPSHHVGGVGAGGSMPLRHGTCHANSADGGHG